MIPEEARRRVEVRYRARPGAFNRGVAEPPEGRSGGPGPEQGSRPRTRPGWEEFKARVSFGLLIGFGIFFLGHFAAIWAVGPIVVGEPSKAILITEIVLVLGIIALGIERWVNHSRTH